MFNFERRWLIPEVIQTSAMDCGPASLKALLEAFAIPVSYGRLREACQTDVDGTSIDVIEETANALGLVAEQMMLPLDHLLLKNPSPLPAIVVTRNAGGDTHFVVVWRQLGNWLQIMNPAIGRVWVSKKRFAQEVYRHSLTVAASDWRDFAETEAFLKGLSARLLPLVDKSATSPLIADALQDESWRSIATLDASVRLLTSLQVSGMSPKLNKQLLHAIYQQALTTPSSIPQQYWQVSPEDNDQLLLSGAVLIAITGAKSATELNEAALSIELQLALQAEPDNAWQFLWQEFKQLGSHSWYFLSVASLLSATMLMIEAMLFRGFLDLLPLITNSSQRLLGLFWLLILVLLLLLSHYGNFNQTARLGRQLDIRLRLAFLKKIPRLNDRYFHSRPISDMAERAHNAHHLRQLPLWLVTCLQCLSEHVLTVLALFWLSPFLWPYLLTALILAIGIPLLLQPLLNERDLKMRTHAGTLSRFYLEALLGLSVVKAHCANAAIQNHHEAILTEWQKASFSTLRMALLIETLSGFSLLLVLAAMLWQYFSTVGNSGSLLLFIFWSLKLPALSGQLSALLRQLPHFRNAVLRFIEPLGAKAEEPPISESKTAKPLLGVDIEFDAVSAFAGGHCILDNLNLHIAAGSQVAIVGSSGAGKSTLVGMLLGWLPATCGEIRVDNAVFDEQALYQLRKQTAWVDPSVQLWNDSLLNNMLYGHETEVIQQLSEVLKRSEVHEILGNLPKGLQTPLGESGSFLSGGEGQRVRLARALLKSQPRLVILDEAFRGLDRIKRQELLATLTGHWQGATLLCISHDVKETLNFDRVLVIEQGQLLEDGKPHDLASDTSSRFYQLLKTEQTVQEDLWQDERWRQWQLQQGHLQC